MNQRERKKHQNRMRKAVAYLQNYMASYDSQSGYLDYSEKTFTDDVIYGLGVALNPREYRYGDGYDKFKLRLMTEWAAKSNAAISEPISKEKP